MQQKNKITISNNIINNFSKYSEHYSDRALIQQHSSIILYNKLLDIIIAQYFQILQNKSDLVFNILDLGSGTGNIKKAIFNINKKFSQNQKIFHNLFISKINNFTELDITKSMLDNNISYNNEITKFFLINGDINDLPFKKNFFNLLVSNFTLQWIQDWQYFIQNIVDLFENKNRYNSSQSLIDNNIRPIIAIAMPNNKSLFELRDSSIISNCNFNFYNLPKAKKIFDYINKFNLKIIDHQEVLIKQDFCSATTAINSIKKIGGGFANRQSGDNNLKKTINKSKINSFNQYFTDKYHNKMSWYIDFTIFSINNI